MPLVDVAFRVSGKEISSDHGYSLYAAVSRILPWVHEDKSVGVHRIRGTAISSGTLELTATSTMRIRLSSEKIGEVLPLSGKTLYLNGKKIVVGIPSVYQLECRPNLSAYMVVIKGFMEPAHFKEAVRKQLDAMNVRGKIEVGKRRILAIKDKTVVGFAVRLSDLNADESLIVQEKGLGGRRHMGCGIFAPCRSVD